MTTSVFTHAHIQMKKSLKDLVVPKLRALGFKGSFPHFKRVREGRTHFLSFQFDKFATSFEIFIANVADVPSALFKGCSLAPEKATMNHLLWKYQLYVRPKTGSWSFAVQYADNRDDRLFESIAREVIPYVLEAEEWFSHGIESPNIYHHVTPGAEAR